MQTNWWNPDQVESRPGGNPTVREGANKLWVPLPCTCQNLQFFTSLSAFAARIFLVLLLQSQPLEKYKSFKTNRGEKLR